MCDVAIPNKEIIFVYEKEVLNRTNQNSVSVSISQAIFSGDTKKLQSLLENFMLQSISSMDGANEAFYHGMMLGLCAVLGNRYQVRSNRESGRRRFDVQLAPLVSGIPGFLFEFKHTNDEHVDLDALADSALRQIDEKKYDAELRSAGINSVIKIGIAFRGKNAVVK
ncbi:MAG: PD-(D/E)XK nuclease domain-containing protein [Enterocloster sp.]